MNIQMKRKIAFALLMGVVTTGIIFFTLLALNLGRVDKRDSQTRVVLIQDCFLRSSHGSRGFVGCGVGFDWAAAAA